MLTRESVNSVGTRKSVQFQNYVANFLEECVLRMASLMSGQVLNCVRGTHRGPAAEGGILRTV